jgi:hypothetical protein
MVSSLHPFEDLPFDTNPALRRLLPARSMAILAFIDHDFGPALRQISMPTWLGWGKRDRLAPQRTAQVLRFMLKLSHDEVFEASGHVPMQTEPERLARSLLSYFARPLQPAPAVRSVEPAAFTRIGSCDGQRDRVFEGDYAQIEIRDCKRVLLRGVHTRSLSVESSSVELQAVTITSPDAAARFANSRVRWTGGRIVARVCVDSRSDDLSFAGVSCMATVEPLRVRGPGRLHASVSSFASASGERAVHGEYKLSRTVDVGGTALTPIDDSSVDVSPPGDVL